MRRTSALLSMRIAATVCFALVCLGASGVARAQQPRDYMLSFQPPGTSLLIDYYGTGAQLTLENRTRIYGDANDLTLGVALVPAYPLGEMHARADLRILFIGIGASLAYRTVWRNLQFEADPDGYCLRCDREGRREVDGLLDDALGTDHWGWGEVRGSVYAPFNEYLVGVSTAALRYEGRSDRTFDWFYTSVYDHGLLGRWETQLFFKHPDWGGIGPFVQLLVLPRGEEHEDQWAIGFNAVTRLDLLRSDDLLFITFLTRPGDPSYGQHSYYSPIRALLIYRVSLTL